tara:strand:+ start:2839 stop:3126 length:288 start_codon:yes stop_codon:yes gene_type:complete
MSRKKKKIKCELVRVEWHDAYEETSGWHDPKILSTIESSKCTSYGLMHKRKKDIVLFGDIAEDSSQEIGRIATIPKAWIKDIKHLGVFEEVTLPY